MIVAEPLGDRVLVVRTEEDEGKYGKIVIPDSAKQKPQLAEVVALGQGRLTKDGEYVPFHVSVGDSIYIDKYAGTDIELGGTSYTIISEATILARIKTTTETGENK